MRIAPFTLISGNNSSGKSTVIQSMALVAQTLAAQLDKEAMLLNGHLVLLGDLPALMTVGNNSDLSIQWELRPDDVEPVADADFGAMQVAYESKQSVGLDKLQCTVTFARTQTAERPRVKSGSLAIETVDHATSSISWAHSADSGPYSAALDTNSKNEVAMRHERAELAGCELRHFLPSRLLVRGDEREADALLTAQGLSLERRFYRPEEHPLFSGLLQPRLSAMLSAAIDAEIPEQATLAAAIESMEVAARDRPDIRDKLRAIRPDIERTLLEDHVRKPQLRGTYLPGRLPDAISYTESYFSTKFHYLGPLREEPHNIYPHPARLGPLDLGRRGEYTASVYHAYADTEVAHCVCDQVKQMGPFAESVRAPLRTAVDEWLRYFEVAEKFSATEMSFGHLLSVDRWAMVHVGTGVSQLLPIVVLGLLAAQDDVIVIEHPELHLHPAIQSRVADFLLFLAMSGRQVIVETHSEHIVNRIRMRVAQDESGDVASRVAVHFATRASMVTSIQEVTINKFGAITEWPEGFFDEAARESESILTTVLKRSDVEGGE